MKRERQKKNVKIQLKNVNHMEISRKLNHVKKEFSKNNVCVLNSKMASSRMFCWCLQILSNSWDMKHFLCCFFLKFSLWIRKNFNYLPLIQWRRWKWPIVLCKSWNKYSIRICLLVDVQRQQQMVCNAKLGFLKIRRQNDKLKNNSLQFAING